MFEAASRPSTAAVAMLHATLDMVGAEAQAFLLWSVALTGGKVQEAVRQVDPLYRQSILSPPARHSKQLAPKAEAALLFSSVKGEDICQILLALGRYLQGRSLFGAMLRMKQH